MECSRACLNGGGRERGEGRECIFGCLSPSSFVTKTQFVMVRKYDNPHNAPKACCQTRYL